LYKVYDFKCEKCGFVKEKMVDSDTHGIPIICRRSGHESCVLTRQISMPKIPTVSVPNYAYGHVKRARNVGHGGSNSRDEGAYSHKDGAKRENWTKKIMVTKPKRKGE
jgi:hypothetical protein